MTSPETHSSVPSTLDDAESMNLVLVVKHIRKMMVAKTSPYWGEPLSVSYATMKAIEDLAHYHELLGAELRLLSFTEAEATLIVTVCRGWWIVGAMDGACLWMELEEYLAIAVADCPSGDPAPAWALELIEKLKRLTPLAGMAVVRAAQRFKYFSTDVSRSTALEAVGLINPARNIAGRSAEERSEKAAAA